MDDFDRLLKYTRAVEDCWGLARRFVEYFGDEPEFSRCVTAPGQPFDTFAAPSQAMQLLESAEGEYLAIDAAMDRWREYADMQDYVWQAVGVSLAPIRLDGVDFYTAHEAALDVAQAVIKRYRECRGDDDIETCFDLAKRLQDLGAIPDVYSRLQAESHAAGNLIGLPPEKPLDGDDGNEDASANTTWKMVHELLAADVTSLGWTTERRAIKAAEWNQKYGHLSGWTKLSTKKLGEIIRYRRKIAARKSDD